MTSSVFRLFTLAVVAARFATVSAAPAFVGQTTAVSASVAGVEAQGRATYVVAESKAYVPVKGTPDIYHSLTYTHLAQHDSPATVVAASDYSDWDEEDAVVNPFFYYYLFFTVLSFWMLSTGVFVKRSNRVVNNPRPNCHKQGIGLQLESGQMTIDGNRWRVVQAVCIGGRLRDVVHIDLAMESTYFLDQRILSRERWGASSETARQAGLGHGVITDTPIKIDPLHMFMFGYISDPSGTSPERVEAR
ncbi:hypothetical protein B0H13DRAFT_1853166 [Mycena leptocephala]|nr:hypothetical protein B0H13DRAFT_1853166 [Mycena leptocephala]